MMNNENNKQSQYKGKLYKIIMIGNAGVGKTCLVTRALKNEYTENSKSTIGYKYYDIQAQIGNKKISLQAWDTCGQEAYQNLIFSLYKRANLAIIVYAIDNRNSFDTLNYWLNTIRQHSKNTIKIVLVGNKSDLNSNRFVTEEEGNKYCENNRLDLFFEASAKEGHNAYNIFTQSLQMLYEDDLGQNDNTFRIGDERDSQGNSCSECY